MPGKAKCERIAKNNGDDNVGLHFDRREGENCCVLHIYYFTNRSQWADKL